MSVGLGLLRCMIDGQFKFSYLDEQGVDRSAFFGDELRVYDYMRRHVERYGTLPQVETVFVEAKVDLVEFPPEPIGFWIERVETRRQAESILAASQKMEKCVADGDVESAREINELTTRSWSREGEKKG